MSTFMANKGNIVRKWYILDAAGKPLGKTAAAAATLLRGKHKPEFTPHADCGDFVVIVNAAKILNITPSAISQSINKLRALFPDPLFIRKGQGVTPTAYATHLHQYISRGMEAFLSALDITGSPHQQRVITIATTPAMGALLMPGLASALKPTFPQILLHNIAIVDAARQLDQRQVDLLIDTHLHSGQAISHHVLYQDRVQMYCRAGHPALDGPQD